ncbi:uncharacterized protein LOC9631095 [Selaginella moellendorffii]|nr:uncharacterized protein LOC9631095 [Selaginella moellendorffii]|eukprot:XP_002967741.2 uncharacterized protein LOC9631095 [Selaginella moellendorffii]
MSLRLLLLDSPAPRLSSSKPPPQKPRSRSVVLRSIRPRASSSASSAAGDFDSNDASPKEAKDAGYKSLLVAMGVPLAAGSLVAAFNRPDEWYFQLKKPSWTPPAPVIGFAWSLLYPLMGAAAWLVWRNGGFEEQRSALTIFGVQLGFNLLWQVAFFGLRNPALAFLDISILVLLVGICVWAFGKSSAAAANAMKVYLLWVIFAAALNYKICALNP